MTDKGIGSKLLGLFVETEGKSEDSLEPAEEKTPAELVAELAGQAVPAARAPGDGRKGVAPPLNLEKAVSSGLAPTDFESVFRDAGMDVAELDRVKKAEELLRSLPDATPQAVKKQIVEASLKAFGFEIEKIAGAAQNQKRALDAYVKVNETATAKAISDAERQIQELNQKIASLRTEIEKRTASLSALSRAAQERKEQVQKVLDFFQVPTPPP